MHLIRWRGGRPRCGRMKLSNRRQPGRESSAAGSNSERGWRVEVCTRQDESKNSCRLHCKVTTLLLQRLGGNRDPRLGKEWSTHALDGMLSEERDMLPPLPRVRTGNQARLTQRKQLPATDQVRGLPADTFHSGAIHAGRELDTLSAYRTLSLLGKLYLLASHRSHNLDWKDGVAWLSVNRF